MLDAVFSLDAVITAVGMVDELLLMMAAVVIAMAVMIAASKPLTTFINARPSLIILCLGLLLMVGFSLIADGFDFHIPRGYLYAAITFSLLIETFNQIALGKRRKWIASLPPRQRVANTVLRLLAGVPLPAPIANAELNALVVDGDKQDAFANSEKDMVRGVLTLADRPVSTIMTPRLDVEWIDADHPKEAVLNKIRNSHHRQFLVSRGAIENVVGIARKEDILELCIDDQVFDLKAVAHPPLAAPERISILQMVDLFRKAPVEMAIVVDEYGELEGVVTQTDLLEAIAGDLPQAENEEPDVKKLEDGALLVNGAISVYDAQTRLGLGSVPTGDFDTLAGFVLFLLGRIPTVGDRTAWQGWRFEVSAMDGHRIDKVLVKRTGEDEQ